MFFAALGSRRLASFGVSSRVFLAHGRGSAGTREQAFLSLEGTKEKPFQYIFSLSSQRERETFQLLARLQTIVLFIDRISALATCQGYRFAERESRPRLT